MTRPEIIRADSIDLQALDNPSAKDHSRQPTRPSPLGSGPPAPHQAEALRDLHEEIAEQQNLSPRVSQEWTNEKRSFDEDEIEEDEEQHDQAVSQNGGLAGANAEEDGDLADAEGDEDEDDMMDKISSSPSIDDGGYPLPELPTRCASLSPVITPISPTLSLEGDGSSSLFMETPVHFPLGYMTPKNDDSHSPTRIRTNRHHHHRSGEYSRGSTVTVTVTVANSEPETRDIKDQERLRLSSRASHTAIIEEAIDSYDSDSDTADGENEDAIGSLEEQSDIQKPHDFSPDDLERMLRSDDRDEVGKPRSLLLEPIPDLSPEKTAQAVHMSPGGAMTIAYESTDEDDDDEIDDEFFPDSPRFIDSGWGGECLQELEDIDFEFVYALHTFVATVEGQANATKGDTMVLLDDSNSYWWLVRVVKDSSIGYLPAEHIETPTERLARLNKHRNIDLSATMLQDQAEKSKNPLKKAIRRRNTKTVQFAAPTYVEASDNDYSSEEEGEEGGQYYDKEQQAAESQATDDDQVTVEPLRTKAEIREVKSEDGSAEKGSSETSRNSDEIFDAQGKSRSRNGTIRNTDSFFKDDAVETRKITLTPNLLRDDSLASTVRTSEDTKDLLVKRPSLDKLEKDGSFDKPRDGKEKKKEKKEKEKKPGMLSGLFKRKDKKSKGDFKDEDIEEIIMGKRSNENQRESEDSAPKESDEFDASKKTEEPVSKPVPQPIPQLEKGERSPSKLQKRGADSPPSKPLEDAPATASMRMVQPETLRELTEPAPTAVEVQEMMSPIEAQAEVPSIMESTRAAPALSNTAPKRPSIPGAFPDSYISTPTVEREVDTDQDGERLSESPVHVDSAETSTPPPALIVDTSSQEEETSSPAPSPSPELVNVNEKRQSKGSESRTSTSTLTPAWNDSHLRTFFDDDGDIRDLLVVVYDNSGVVPAGPDHPVAGKLFKEENARLKDITSRLDGMLGDWLARKRPRQVVASR